MILGESFYGLGCGALGRRVGLKLQGVKLTKRLGF